MACIPVADVELTVDVVADPAVNTRPAPLTALSISTTDQPLRLADDGLFLMASTAPSKRSGRSNSPPSFPVGFRGDARQFGRRYQRSPASSRPANGPASRLTNHDWLTCTRAARLPFQENKTV